MPMMGKPAEGIYIAILEAACKGRDVTEPMIRAIRTGQLHLYACDFERSGDPAILLSHSHLYSLNGEHLLVDRVPQNWPEPLNRFAGEFLCLFRPQFHEWLSKATARIRSGKKLELAKKAVEALDPHRVRLPNLAMKVVMTEIESFLRKTQPGFAAHSFPSESTVRLVLARQRRGKISD